MINKGDSVRVRAVEIGEVLPRKEIQQEVQTEYPAPAFWPLVGAVALALFAAVLALSSQAELLFEVLFGGAGGIAPTVAKFGVALLLFVATIGLLVYAFQSGERPLETRHVPIVPDELNLKHISSVDITDAAKHLSGAANSCYPPRGLPPGEIVIARITRDNAEKIASIPDACAEHRRSDSLWPILIGVPNTEPEVIERASEDYTSTLLIDAEQQDRLPELLGLLPYLCMKPERKEIQGIGSALLVCIDVSQTGQHDTDLEHELGARLGHALSEEAQQLRQDHSRVAEAVNDGGEQAASIRERPPNITLVSAPTGHLDTVVTSLPAIDEPIVMVRSEPSDTIRIIRFYQEASLPTDDEQIWTIRRAAHRSASVGESGDGDTTSSTAPMDVDQGRQPAVKRSEPDEQLIDGGHNEEN